VSLAQAGVAGRDVSLVWYASGDLPVGAVVERTSGTDGPWRELGFATVSGDRVTYLDHVAPVGRLRYRLAYRDDGEVRFSAEVEVEVPDLTLAVQPLGTRGTQVSFTLPAAGAVRIELHDLAGRRVEDLALGALPAGRHVRDLTTRSGAGVYFVRLSHGGRSVTARMVVID
jgi:hypothetical protein